MKTLLILALFSLVVITPAISQSSDVKEVETAVEFLRTAMLEGNKSSLENIVAKDLSYGHSSGKVENKSEFIEVIASGKSDYKVMNFTDQIITISDNIAIVRHVFTGEVINDGVASNPKLGVMQIWQKQKNKWLLVARQSCKL